MEAPEGAAMTPTTPRAPIGHTRCPIDGCDRVKQRDARCCYRHEHRNADLMELDVLIAAKCDTPRAGARWRNWEEA
jgi:hypothetical protein